MGGLKPLSGNIIVGEMGDPGISTIRSSGSRPYTKGYPFYGSSEPNVSAQWVFDEASGAIVDEVTGVSLAVSASPPTFSQTLSAPYANISPGIKYTAANPQVQYHSKAGADSNLDLNTSNFTMEFWVSITQGYNGEHFVDCRDTATGEGWRVYYNYNGGTDQIVLNFYIAAFADKYCTFTVTGLYNSGPRKIRIVGTRSGNAELFMDGVSKGTVDISAWAAQSIKCNNIYIGSSYNTAAFSGLGGTIYEFRLSLNNTNNSGGPGGG